MDYLSNIEIPVELASKRIRIAAALIDFFIYWSIGFIIGIFTGQHYNNDEGVGYSLSGLPAFLFMLVWIPLIPLFEGWKGQTIGKKILKIKVVKQNGNPTNMGSSFVRHLFDIVDLFFFIGLLIAALNPQKKRIGDLVAGTIVVKN